MACTPCSLRGASVGHVIHQVVDSVCKSKYNWLAGKLARTCKFQAYKFSKKRRVVTEVTAVKRIFSGRTSHISHQGSVVLHINVVN